MSLRLYPAVAAVALLSLTGCGGRLRNFIFGDGAPCGGSCPAPVFAPAAPPMAMGGCSECVDGGYSSCYPGEVIHDGMPMGSYDQGMMVQPTITSP
jgi:hypothetical protein